MTATVAVPEFGTIVIICTGIMVETQPVVPLKLLNNLPWSPENTALD
jgi:hypothetical protein